MKQDYVEHLVRRYRKANRRWTLAVFRAEYAEPPENPAQLRAYWMAVAWRAATHAYENELLKLREVRQAPVDGAASYD